MEEFARIANLRVIHGDRTGDAWGVLGTLLGCSYFEPADRSLLNRIRCRMANISQLLCTIRFEKA